MVRLPHVALLIETSRSYGRGVLVGVRRYLREHGPWSVYLEPRALETQAPGCQNLQDAYLERARVHIALGQVGETRIDLDRCVGLAKSNPSGRECGRLLASLP